LISTWRPSLTLSRHAVTGVIKPQSTDRTDKRKKQLPLNNPNQRGLLADAPQRQKFHPGRVGRQAGGELN
jgi:hypothetical protein